MNVMYMHHLNTTCPPGYYSNGFMANGALSHTFVSLHVPGIQETQSAQISARATSIINMEKECGLKKHTKCSNPKCNSVCPSAIVAIKPLP